MDSLFSTHPSTDNRIAELLEMAREMGLSPVDMGTPMADASQHSPWSKASTASPLPGPQRRGPWS
jgi:heat shock protein HtpX